MTRHGGETDSSATPSSSRGRRRGIRIWHILLTLLLCGVAFLLALRWHWRHEFHRRVAAIRAAGYPATPEEHDAWYPWPQSGANAAHWILGAAAMHQQPPKEDWERLQKILSSRAADRLDLEQPLDADLRALLEQYIQTNSKALESLHEGSTIAECRYPVDLSGGPGTRMPHISEVRGGVLLLCLEAVLHADRGDPNGAVHAVVAAVRVADSLDREPVMISRLVRTGGLILAQVTLELILNHAEPTSQQVELLCQVFHDLDLTGGLARALAGERCMMYPFFDRPQAVGRVFSDLPPVPVLEIYAGLGLAAREGIIYLDAYQEHIRITQLPVSQRRAALDAADARYGRDEGGMLLWKTGPPSGLVRLDGTRVVTLETARVALAVERYRRARGELPETLELLVPDHLSVAPEDPFDGNPLRYRRWERGYMVYSVGEDGKDDGGRLQPAKGARTNGETWDLVFQVHR